MSSENSIRVPLVDDEPAIRRSLRLPLSQLGFQVLEASRGEEALHLIRAGTFDVVLLDINMPGIGGMATLQRLRAFAPHLPILMLTVRDGEKDKVEALDSGADDYITKPFGFRECLARIRSAVRRAQMPERPKGPPHRHRQDRSPAGPQNREKIWPAHPPDQQRVRYPLLSHGPCRTCRDPR